MLVAGTVIGAAWPEPGAWLGSAQLNGLAVTASYSAWSTVSALLVSGIFFVNGLQLKTDAALQALRAPYGIALGLVEILAMTPLLGFAVAAAPGLPAALRLGIALFQLMPTTLSAGPLIVGMAGGSAPLGMLLTVLANLLAVGTLALTVPLMVQVLADSPSGSLSTVVGASSPSVPPLPIVLNLIFTLLIPLFTGKLVHDVVPYAKAFVAANPVSFKLVPSLFLAMIPWMTLSQSASALRSQAPGDIVAACFAAVAAHLLLLAMAWATTSPKMHRGRLPPADRKACVIMGAQKSLPVAVTVLVGLNLGEAAGLATVPLVISQLFQTIFDSIVAGFWAGMVSATDNVGPDSVTSQENGAGNIAVPPINVEDRRADTGVTTSVGEP